MPKYCIRADGAVYPFCASLATDARFKTVDELPAGHLHAIGQARSRAEERVLAAQLMREQQDARQEQRRQQSVGRRRQLAATPAVDPAAAAEAQRQADAFGGKEPG